MTNDEIKREYDKVGGPPRSPDHNPDHGLTFWDFLGIFLGIAAVVTLVVYF